MSVRCLHLNFVPSSAPSSSISAPYQRTHLALAPTRGPGRPACRALRANPSLPTQLFPPSRSLSLFVSVSCFRSVFINLYLLLSDTHQITHSNLSGDKGDCHFPIYHCLSSRRLYFPLFTFSLPHWLRPSQLSRMALDEAQAPTLTNMPFFFRGLSLYSDKHK